MKEPERFPADDPREWMNRARSSLAMAKNRVPQAYLDLRQASSRESRRSGHPLSPGTHRMIPRERKRLAKILYGEQSRS